MTTPSEDEKRKAAQNKRKAEQRKKAKEAGLVRADVSIHPSRLDELRVVEKRFQKPKRNTK